MQTLQLPSNLEDYIMKPFIFICAIIASVALAGPTESAGGIVLDKRQVLSPLDILWLFSIAF